jgi:hypothetical protein
MKQKKNEQQGHLASAEDLKKTETLGELGANQIKRDYESPRIVSSKIFHKVMLSTPQPGFPGCTTY